MPCISVVVSGSMKASLQSSIARANSSRHRRAYALVAKHWAKSDSGASIRAWLRRVCASAKLPAAIAANPASKWSCQPPAARPSVGGGCAGATANVAYDLAKKYGVVEEDKFGYQDAFGAKVKCALKANTQKPKAVESLLRD